MNSFPAKLFALLVGCGTTKTFENRLTTTPDCARGFVASMYGPIGITSELVAADIAIICQNRKAVTSAP